MPRDDNIGESGYGFYTFHCQIGINVESWRHHFAVVLLQRDRVADNRVPPVVPLNEYGGGIHRMSGGVTEAGGGERGLIKSSIGIGAMLCDGIGDTLRVSLTDDPVLEVASAKKILRAVGIEGQTGLDIVSCPTCGRTKIELIPLVKQFEAAVAAEGLEDVPVKVALMGCVVNGPGEAREADVGIAGGIGEAVLFRHGEIVEKIPEDAVIDRLIREVRILRDGMQK